ncbi:hypothetical protein Sango_3110300 [Sesamum angolense]|uniref:Reverse transcriptase zinc-binding domain-containing protein n=1 Tax=Sesamum angolense TaxID=2727404 RepID=A0AAE1VYY2_9LAMI|nr:hypothetical protein Sango_3110300 [Sesamum angolense]
MVDVKGGSWGWRKLLRLRSALLPYIDLKIGDRESFPLWHDPWHSLGPLVQRFPNGSSRTNIPAAATLSTVIVDGAWRWPLITDMECIEIIHVLPTIHNGSDSILWRGGDFSTTAVYDIFRSPGPKGGVCVLCGRELETHEHLFFRCSYSRRCIRVLKSTVRFTWPNRAWGWIFLGLRRDGPTHSPGGLQALLAAIVYHIWQEHNQRVFMHTTQPSSTIARIAIDAIRQKILSIELLDSVSSRGLYRLWRIPWPVRDTA